MKKNKIRNRENQIIKMLHLNRLLIGGIKVLHERKYHNKIYKNIKKSSFFSENCIIKISDEKSQAYKIYYIIYTYVDKQSPHIKPIFFCVVKAAKMRILFYFSVIATCHHSDNADSLL